MDEWRNLSASDLGRGIGAGQIDPVALTEGYLDAVAASPVGDRIYARMTKGRALAEAEAAQKRAKAGVRRGLLDGVPLSWKDLVDSAGVATEAGSALLAGRIPEADATVLAAATLGGSVCLGKTHMTELAFSGLGLNPVTATPPNVHNPDWAPGGSSSGAAASVAFGLAPAAIGSDTGGSVRVPAAWNSLVGLKTTSGRVSLEGVVDLCARFDTIGPLTKTVEDAAEVLALIEGGKAADLRGVSLSGARLAVLDTLAMDDVRDVPGSAFEDALSRLAAAGAVIERVTVPEVLDTTRLQPVLFAAEAYGRWAAEIEAAPDKMYDEVLKRFRQGVGFLATEYVTAVRDLDRCRAAYAAATAGFDAVLVPTSPILPPDAGRLLSDSGYFAAENLLALRNTRIGNMLGLCVLTLPTSVDACGLSLMAAPFAEERVLRLGAAAESALQA